MIQYFFIVDNSANSIVFEAPKEEHDRFKDTLGLISSKVKFTSMKIAERFESKYEELDFLLQKMTDTLLFGSFVKNVGNRKGPLFKMYDKLFANVTDVKTLKQNERFKALVKKEIADYNSAKGDMLKKISDLQSQAEEQVRREQERQNQKAAELLDLNNELEETLEIAIENKEAASEIKTQVWILDLKMKLFLFGSTILIIGLGALFLFRMVL